MFTPCLLNQDHIPEPMTSPPLGLIFHYLFTFGSPSPRIHCAIIPFFIALVNAFYLPVPLPHLTFLYLCGKILPILEVSIQMPTCLLWSSQLEMSSVFCILAHIKYVFCTVALTVQTSLPCCFRTEQTQGYAFGYYLDTFQLFNKLLHLLKLL